MAFRKNSSDDSISDHDLLSVFNGYCKINLVVPQISLFHTNDNLLPINAKAVNSSLSKNAVDNMANIFNNLKVNENAGQSTDEYQLYSKPSCSNNSNSAQKKNDNRTSLSPKNKRKKNKSKTYTTIDNQTLSSMYSEQNTSVDYNNQYKNDKLGGGSVHGLQDQQHKKKPTKIVKNPRSQTSQQNSKDENALNSGLNSQCPICFGTYPAQDIEVHASRCNPE